MNQLHQDYGVLDSPETLDLLSWRTAISQAVVPLDIEAHGSDPFVGRYRQACVGEVKFFDMQTTAHIVRRSPALITAEQRKFYKMSLQLSGRARLEQSGRTTELNPGDLAVYDTQHPYTLSFPEGSRAMVMIFPQEMVELTADEVSQVTAVRFPGEHGMGRLINPFFAELGSNLDQLGSAYASRLVHSALDLMMTMLAEELHSREQGGSPHSCLGRQVRDYIVENLGDDSLSPASIAEAHFISLRYLYTLFAGEGTPVSAWIRSQRLAHIRRDLSDPIYAQRPVSWIAGQWGLHDAAHFSRLFKADYGVSPAAYRRHELSRIATLSAAA